MYVFAFYNLKGGVGKTTTAVNITHVASLMGTRSLIWDLDPQGASTFYFGRKAKVKGGVERLMTKDDALQKAIKGTDYPNLDLLPADFSYRHFDDVLEEFKSNKQLGKLSKSLRKDYDVLFLDCPPSLSHLSENVMRAADVLIMPMLPTTLSLRTYEQVSDFLEEVKKPPLLLPFFSMVDRRKTTHRSVVDAFPKDHANTLPTAIPYSSILEKMGITRAPVTATVPKSTVSVAYHSLWQDIQDAFTRAKR
ncbi:MAG: AAA family ATPase [Pseudomonadota bacterium]